jgi:osmoprotectant transport system permease protein
VGRMFDVLRRPDYPGLVLTHVELSALALLIAVAIALPVALLVRNSPLATTTAINIGNVGRAVPSLAILSLALPLLGFGFAPALIALAALSVPPVLINATTGLREVDREIINAGRGMGLSGSQILARIQLPIAAPVIFTGIRSAAVMVVASGGGGLGDLIVEGFQRGDPAILLVGALSVAILAIITEVGFSILERTFTPKGLKIARKRRGK